jgi:hypothetical protein
VSLPHFGWLGAIILVQVAALGGCATRGPGFSSAPVGRDFQQSVFARFTLDQTSVEEAEGLLGLPMKQTSVRGLVGATSRTLTPGTPYIISTLNYYYFPYGAGLPPQNHPGKTATLLFLQGKLIAYGADSSIPGEANAPVDENRLSDLHQCQTTRAEAVALLGQPNGEAMHVLDAQAGSVEIIYSWLNIDAGTVQQRSLHVFFDRSGAMSNYTMVNNVAPLGGLPVPAQRPVPTPMPPACPGTTSPGPHHSRVPT